ncbi:MAG: phosphoenolpyruvate carboxykinase (ATP), partial [Prevotellaceae bacterium]|nr:phosphoenolpyruvate carboxykinase (ATP) [Prevotellaceae bacterium]
MANLDLTKYGIDGNIPVVYNPSYEELFQAEMSSENQGFEKGILTNTGAVSVDTGKFTGRSPKDRFIVKDAVSENTIWWDGNIN